jgi:hypothetical protein
MHPSGTRPTKLELVLITFLLATAQIGYAQVPSLNDIQVGLYKGQPVDEFLSAGGFAAVDGPAEPNNPQPGYHDNGRGGNSFVNDPCLDPPPPQRRHTVQSETEIAVLNTSGSMGKKIVVGYNDSYGFYDNTQGLSGYSYSVDGGNTFIDGGGLPPAVPDHGACASSIGPTRGHDCYFGDPVLVVHNDTQRFFYSSIYKLPDDTFSISVNRGTFQTAPPQGIESIANTRCLNDPTQYQVPDPPQQISERIIWEPPVVILKPTTATSQDFLDKEWLYVDQTSGTLYVTYTRFGATGSTPLELMRCLRCARLPNFTTANWDGPYTIVPNELDTFNQATMPITTRTGRVVVTWYARHFSAGGIGPEDKDSIQAAYSDTDGTAFVGRQDVAVTNPQGEPPGYNRHRSSILNAPYINPDNFVSGNVYITYFSGKTPVTKPPFASAGDVFMSRSMTNAASWDHPVKMNDDPGTTSHVFPTVQVNKNGYVYAGWLDRRNDPSNILTDAWANVSKDYGATFGPDREQTDVATSWFVRADARPNFGDYNSSELLGFNDFVMTWADGRFPPPAPTPQAATPDAIFTIANGLGVGSLSQ